MVYVPETTYDYKVYKGIEYIGSLNPYVISQFGYTQEINKTFVEIQVDVSISSDVAPLLVEPIETEDSSTITTEDNVAITIDRQPDIVSSSNSKALIQNNNRLKIYEKSHWHPNGLLVFDGYINTWQTEIGGNDIISFTARSLADDMSDYILTGGNVTAEITQSSVSSGYSSFSAYMTGGKYLEQFFTPTSSFYLSKLSLMMSGYPTGPTTTVSVYSGTTLLGSSSLTITGDQEDYQDRIFTFLTPILLEDNNQYSLRITKDIAAGLFGIAPSSTYSGILRGWNGSTFTNTSHDLYFIFYSEVTLTDYIFNDKTASEIAQTSMDDYISKGGSAYYDSSDTDTFPVLTETNDYTFKAATELEVQNKALQLTTDDIFYKVDPGSQLYFFGYRTTATNGVGTIHNLVIGKHFQTALIGASVDEVRNYVSLTGGDIGGGVNLFSEYNDSASITAQGRQRLERIVDNRITIQATADSIAAAIFAERANEKTFGSVTILNNVYDTRTIEIGHAIRFKGIGNFVENDLYNVVGRTLIPDGITLVLGFIPERLSDKIDKLSTEIVQIQTINNPDSPD